MRKLLEDKGISDAEVQRTYHSICEAVAVEPSGSDGNRASLGELGRTQNLRGTVIAIVCRAIQMGTNLVT